jgi:glycogen debranching enzyme
VTDLDPDAGGTPREAALEAAGQLLSPEGWAYASSPPVEAGDPGRFHALFGRDSLIFALQVLRVRPDVAPATLRALAARQGTVGDPEIEEQPGKILHEYRSVVPAWLIEKGWPVRQGGTCYYGTSDATSWFLILLEATGDARLRDELRDSWRAAAGWLERALEAGHGFVRCGPRRFPVGLAQQGWRDSQDPAADESGSGIVREDGSMPDAPLADADSQAAALAALDALTRLDAARPEHWAAMAELLRRRIQETFTPDVMALDGHDALVSGAGSQLGWLLWSGALDGAAADAAIERLTRPDVLTPFGVRTLAETHPAFLPHGYHRGGVWPFDNWFAWGGLRRYGADEHAEKIRGGVRRALAVLGRYPELYAVDRDGELRAVPVANRVQAWTVGAMVAFDVNWPGSSR